MKFGKSPMKKINLTILTPDKTLVSDTKVDFIVLPAMQGEMGVLPGHCPYMVQLKEGILKYIQDGKENYLSVFWGFAMIKDNEVTVLTELGEMAQELNEERARQEFQRAKNALAMKGADMDLDSAQASLQKAMVRLKLAELKKKKPQRGGV